MTRTIASDKPKTINATLREAQGKKPVPRSRQIIDAIEIGMSLSDFYASSTEQILIGYGLCQTAAQELARMPHFFDESCGGSIKLLKGAEHACPAYTALENILDYNMHRQTPEVIYHEKRKPMSKFDIEVAIEAAHACGLATPKEFYAPPEGVPVVVTSELPFKVQRSLGLLDRINPNSASHCPFEHMISTMVER